MHSDELGTLDDFVKKIIKRDMDIFYKDYNDSIGLSNKNEELEDVGNSKKSLIADFTEYNPLHNGHYHCMNVAKEKIPNNLFVAVVPGLFERSGRGLPFIMTREARAKTAIAAGADIVVEGPPMGIMGSGQYSLCLAKTFKALGADFIPRGYRPFEGYDIILDRIKLGHSVAPRPYQIMDMDKREVLYEGKLEEDNYVITSLSKSLKRINFDFKDKFIFVKRIEGVSGTLIREATMKGDFSNVNNMMPSSTIDILDEEIKNNRAPLNMSRDFDSIIDSVNKLSFTELVSLNLIDDKTAKKIVNFREDKDFESIEEVQNCISYGFSSHFNHRVLSVLETKINKDIIYDYIDNYPSKIRVLDYKNENVLEEFKEKINENNRRIELWQ
ncbi:nucleotidyltransferase family protein [Methanobrevibacter sp.]|uniref:nucleotidyltransferase family protein n=1 Tax=Methanobrevibacter sp. TaxID=66852 RepID=UPI002619541F|nr:nucleotidyltransferase family protein [uncultured Methanobrevibacter sp.]